MRPRQRGPKLPAQLLDELSSQDASFDRRRGNGPRDRKERRKAERTQKRHTRQPEPFAKRQKLVHQSSDDEEVDLDEDGPQQSSSPQRSPSPEPERPAAAERKPAKARRATEIDDAKPAPAQKVSRKVQEQLDEDDQMIAELERRLGIKKKKKLPKAFEDDGLADLLAELGPGTDEEDDDKREGDAWLAEKRRKATQQKPQLLADDGESHDEEMDDDNDDNNSPDDVTDDDEEGFDEDDEDGEDDVDEDQVLSGDASGDEFEGFESETSESAPPKRKRENPYAPPVADGEAPAKKYIPPSLRKPSSDSEDYTRLRRQIQGLVNRLTEANLLSIVSGIEQLYANHARHDVTTILADLLLTSVCEPTSLPDTLIILPAGFIAAVYKIIGVDFGANILLRIVEAFDQNYAGKDGQSETSKETSNLITLLAELYNFQVIGSNLIFDYMRLFLERLSELNTELLLRIIRMSGPQLRQDDPSSLKDVVTLLRPAVAAVGEANISVRTKFMIETINDLKNNKMKTGAAASAVTSEHTIRMKKMLGTLNSRNIKASEPLRIGLKDIAESDKKGKWWLVGASWAGHEPTTAPSIDGKAILQDDEEISGFATYDLAQLAREQRMNTDVRRAIFVTIMSASDYQDAYLRLMKLNLKRAQELDIPKVIIHCASSEDVYNPYYTLVAKRLCGDKRLRMAFQFSLWDLFRRMGESGDDDDTPDADDEDGRLDTRKIVNLAKLYGALMVEGGITLTALKHLNLLYLQTQTKTFIEVLLITVLLGSQRRATDSRDEEAVVKIMMAVQDMPGLARGLKYFVRKVVAKSDLAGGKKEQRKLKWGCDVASDILETMASKETLAA